VRKVCRPVGWTLLIAVSFRLASASKLDSTDGTEWPAVGGDNTNARYSALARINTSNVRRLGGAWFKELQAPTRAPGVIVNGILFISDANSIYALNPANGDTIWAYKPDGAAPARGGVAAGEGLVFSGLSDTRLIALDQRSGRLVWSTYSGNAPVEASSEAKTVDFGGGVPKFNPKVGFIANAPTYVDGIVTSGITGGDGGTRGKIVGLSAKDGKHLWDFFVIPSPGEPGSETWPNSSDALNRGGGAVWSVGAADPDLDVVYYGTGNAAPANAGETRPGNNLYTASVVALDARTGKLKWHFQLTHHDIWEMDVSTPVILFTADRGLQQRKALAVMRADGYLFLLDRVTGTPISPVEERPVQQEVRQRTAPTQPFPLGADRFGPECADPKAMPAGFSAGCYFQPVYFDQQNKVFPLTNVRQAPMSYDPRSGYFYVMGVDFLYWYRRVSNPYVFALSHPPGSSEQGLYAAIDGASGKIVWQRKSPWGLETGSGALTTAGGLLFYTAGDGNVVASNSATGEILWQFQTGYVGSATLSNTSAVPLSTYEVGHEQFVLVPIATGLWGLKLNGQLPPKSTPRAPARTFGFTGIVNRLGEGDEIGISTVAGDTFDPDDEHYVDEFAFAPLRAKVKAGQEIKWTNYGLFTHTVVSSDGSWTTGELRPGQSILIKVDKPGVYTYFSTEFPFSKGQLFVE